MIKQNVSLEFIKLNASEKYPFGGNIIDCITQNPTLFPRPTVPLETLTTVNENYSTALMHTENGSKQSRSLFEKLEKEWNKSFRTIAEYVNSVADGDVSIINAAGFNATKGERSPAPQPTICKDFEADAPKAPGVIAINCKAQKNSHGYIYFAAEDGVSIEQTGNQLSITVGGVTTHVLLSTKTNAQFENMPTLKKYHVSAITFNATSAGPITNGQVVVPQ